MRMKKCCKCKEEKEDSEFNKRKRSKDGLNSRCRKCHREYDKTIYKNSEKRRDTIRNCKRNKTEANRIYVRIIKESNPCTDCGIKYPHYVMDFDHLKDKVVNVADLANSDVSTKRIQKEIDKCELVCANCHRIRTHKRKQDKL